MANNDTFENPAFALEEEGKHQVDQTGDESDLNINNTEPSSTKSPCQNKKVQIQDGHDVTTNENFCGIWFFVKRIYGHLYQRLGLLLTICSAFCFSVKALFLEVLTKTVGPFQVVVMIMPIMVLGPLFFLTYKRIPLPKNYILYGWLLLGGISTSSYLSLFTLSLSKMDVADAVTIVYTSLVFVGLLSWIILKETPTIYHFVFSLLSFLGVVFIARPPFLFGNESNNSEVNILLIGTGFALGAALATAFVLTTIRKQTKLGIHTFISMLNSAVIVILTNVVVCTATRSWRVPNTSEYLYATGAGLSFFFAQLTMYLALKFESATYVNITITVEIVFAFLWQFAFLQVRPLWTSYVGSSLIVAACIGITLTERKQATSNVTDVAS